MKRYPAGLHVQVHYDPNDPDESVLEPGPGWSSLFLLLLGLLFLSIGSIVLLSFLLPLLMAVVMSVSAGGGAQGDMLDFELAKTPSSGASGERLAPRSRPVDDEDDGIRIG